MARGDFLLFEEFADKFGQGDHQLDTDTLKLGIVDSTLTPLQNIASPTWSDFSANEVSTAGGYPANGIEITYGGVTRWLEADGDGKLDAADIVISQNGSGFTDADWAILYESVGDAAIGFIDLDGPVSEQAGDININWNASGVLTVSIP